MKQAHVNLAPEGAPVIGLLTVCALCSALLHWAVPTLVLLALLAFSLHFFRDPARVVPRERDLAVSPADGKIIRIAEREDPFSGEPRICVSIFMNVFSVHVNRSPVAGTVRGIRYACGEFFNASWDKASRDNEHCAWSLRDDEGLDWSFVQIAGFVARRIVPRAEPGDRLARGERFGMIRFGSRVDLYLPRGYDAAVGIADAVYAGQSVVARKNQLAGQDDYPPRPQSEETDAEVRL